MNDQLYATIEDTVFDSIGCTEPVAVAYAATAAYQHVGGTVSSIECMISVNVLKNAMSVGIPGSDRKGIPYAVALGVSGGDWTKGLELFEGVDEQKSAEAAELASRGIIDISLYTGGEKIYIYTKVRSDRGVAEALIRGGHDTLEWIKVDGETVYGDNPGTGVDTEAQTETSGREEQVLSYTELEGLSMEELVRMVEKIGRAHV